MLFKQSCRAFAALVFLFLLVVQVVAAPTKSRNAKYAQVTAAAQRRLHFKESMRVGATHAHQRASVAHLRAHVPNIPAAVKHEFASHEYIVNAAVHGQAAQKHREMAQSHLTNAASHASAANALRTGAHAWPTLGQLAATKKDAEKSRDDATVHHVHAQMSSKFMTTANELQKASRMQVIASDLARKARYNNARRRHAENGKIQGDTAEGYREQARIASTFQAPAAALVSAPQDIATARLVADHARHWQENAYKSSKKSKDRIAEAARQA